MSKCSVEDSGDDDDDASVNSVIRLVSTYYLTKALLLRDTLLQAVVCSVPLMRPPRFLKNE